jgi:RimJ/RimL family protein N-acetyltransferase
VSIPHLIETARLTLRPWHPDDAAELAPILEANFAHLGPWIPPAVSTPAAVDVLRVRLTNFAADFAAERSFRFAMRGRENGELLGELDLFSRNADGRVVLSSGDRAEIGYWLRADRTGRGLVIDGVRALIEIARAVPAFAHIEIRCDAANAPSAAIPTRLGFHLSKSDSNPDGGSQVWTMSLRDASAAGRSTLAEEHVR